MLKKTVMEQLAQEEQEADPTTEVDDAAIDLVPVPRAEQPITESASESTTGTSSTSSSTPVRVETKFATKLYVTIDGLKFRKGPSMDSIVIMTLPLGQELEFMNEVSDTTQQISLGNGVMADERWIKVKHWKGHTGWVYGAGVHYFKTEN